jgi:hypothetical protein
LARLTIQREGKVLDDTVSAADAARSNAND